MEKIISPGVFTRENDQSYLPSGISEIGAAFIGPTKTGPAFKPTIVSSFSEFEIIFGTQTEKTYIPYAVKNYLKNAGVATIVRVLGIDGWLDATTDTTVGVNSAIELLVSGSNGTDTKTAAVLALTSGSNYSTEVTLSGTSNEFYIESSSYHVTCSYDLSNQNHITKVFGTSPDSIFGNQLASQFYLYKVFSSYADGISNVSGSVDVVSSSFANITFNTNKNHSKAITPWIQSQKLSGTAHNLFKFHTISDGSNSNRLYKVMISEVAKPESGSTKYGKFNVSVRDYSDTDTNPSVYETFANCNLDPTSTDYILRKIGDQYTVTDSSGKIKVYGDYSNKSKYLRIEGSTGIANLSNQLVPFGYDEYLSTVSSSVVSPTEHTYQGTADVYKNYIPWGIDFTNLDIDQYFDAIPDFEHVLVGSDFNLDDEVGHNSSSLYSGSLSGSSAPTEMLRFMIGFQKGFDGIPQNRPIQVGSSITAANVMGYDLSGGATAGTVAYKKALDSISNQDEYDVNMIVLPGIMQKYHPTTTEQARLLCNTRQDCFYLMDCVGQEDTIQDALDSVNSIDNNYTGTYYPWLKVMDTSTNQLLWVPPSVSMVGAFSFNDRIGAPWYAPAGLNRGGLDTALEVRNRLTHADRDQLYNGRVNPIAVFPGQGITAWGQKTLQAKSSALDRINVRRLLIEIKKYIASTSRYLVFEQNTTATRNRFTSLVNPYLASVQNKSGLYAFKVVMDESNNTPDVIDRNFLVGHIFIQPTKTAEFIDLTFNVQATGASFT